MTNKNQRRQHGKSFYLWTLSSSLICVLVKLHFPSRCPNANIKFSKFIHNRLQQSRRGSLCIKPKRLELTFNFGEAAQLQLDDMAWHRFQKKKKKNNDGLHNIKRHYAQNVQHRTCVAFYVCADHLLTIIYFPSQFGLISTDNRDTVELWHNRFFVSFFYLLPWVCLDQRNISIHINSQSVNGVWTGPHQINRLIRQSKNRKKKDAKQMNVYIYRRSTSEWVNEYKINYAKMCVRSIDRRNVNVEMQNTRHWSEFICEISMFAFSGRRHSQLLHLRCGSLLIGKSFRHLKNVQRIWFEESKRMQNGRFRYSINQFSQLLKFSLAIWRCSKW